MNWKKGAKAAQELLAERMSPEDPHWDQAHQILDAPEGRLIEGPGFMARKLASGDWRLTVSTTTVIPAGTMESRLYWSLAAGDTVAVTDLPDHLHPDWEKTN